MRRTGRTPIDDDVEKTGIRPLEASMPLSIMGKEWLQNERRCQAVCEKINRMKTGGES